MFNTFLLRIVVFSNLGHTGVEFLLYTGFNSRYFSRIAKKKELKVIRLKYNFLNFDYNYPPVIFARFVLCGAFGFPFGRSCVFRDPKL